ACAVFGRDAVCSRSRGTWSSRSRPGLPATERRLTPGGAERRLSPDVRGPMQYSAMPVRTVIERGVKAQSSVACSLDWLGWSGGAKTRELALETLESYRGRYRPIADL